MYKHNSNNFNMTLTTTLTSPQTKQQQQKQQQQQQNSPALKRRKGDDGKGVFRIKKRCPRLLIHSFIPILVFFCWLPDFIVALKDVSVTIPQAVKRGSNAMLTCNYDMENDTLYSVKWYKGRREFYRYTPKENPAMKVFPSQSGLNVERNLSNQSHIVLLAVPLNISGKFTCEISVEAPSFQTAMVSGEMEVVELPEEQATVTGIQPRYRIGDLVDGNCSIKYSKPAANLTWTINGIVVPPHHIKTYQIEKYEETNLESVMSAVHFMVTTQHFVKGQMRLKCTASIFDIFKEEIESVIEEDRPRIMASGQSYPPDHGYGGHSESDGYEHNESYLTYFSAPKSSAPPNAEFVIGKVVKKSLEKIFELMRISVESCTPHSHIVANLKSCLDPNNIIYMENSCYTVFDILPLKVVTATLIILLVVALLTVNQQKQPRKYYKTKLTQNNQLAFNCIKVLRQIANEEKENSSTINVWRETQFRNEMEQQNPNGCCYQDAKNDDCQAKCSQGQQYQDEKNCLVANQNAINEKIFRNDSYINTISENGKNKTIAATITAIDGQHNMSEAVDFTSLLPTSCATIHLPPYSTFSSSSLRSSTSTLPALSSSSSSSASSSSSSSLSLSSSLGHRKTYAHDSFPLCAVDASKSNNAKCMSKDQTLLMTFTASVANGIVVVASVIATSYSLCTTATVLAPITATSVRALVLESKLLHTSVHSSLAAIEANLSPSPSQIFSRNNYLMAFIRELLLHQC